METKGDIYMFAFFIYIMDVSFYYGYLNWPIIFFSSFYDVGYEKLTTIYNHCVENKLNSTRMKCGFDIYLLRYIKLIKGFLCVQAR